MRKRGFVTVLIVLTLSAWGVSAQDQPDGVDYSDETSIIIGDPAEETEPAERPPGAVVTAWDVARMVLILLVVLGTIFLLFKLMKRAGRVPGSNNDLILLHSTTAVGGGRALHLIEVEGELFLVGSSESSVGLVAKIEDKEAIDRIRFKLTTPPEGGTGGFTQVLFRLLGSRGGSKVDGAVSQNRKLMDLQRERLKKL